MTISRLNAIDIAKAFVKSLQSRSRFSAPLVVLEDETREEEFGWIVFYDLENYKQRDPNVPPEILGNAPLIVSRADGSVHPMGTANPMDFYIELFRRTGSTNPEAEAGS